MRDVFLHLRQAQFTQGQFQTAQAAFQLFRGEAWRQQTAHGLGRALALVPLALAHFPEVHRRLPAQQLHDLVQMADAVADVFGGGALFRAQRPDDAIQWAPRAQLAPLFEQPRSRLALHAAAPQQHGVFAFQPLLGSQPWGDGFDLLRLAHHQQQADLVAPEEGDVGAQVLGDLQMFLRCRGTRGGGFGYWLTAANELVNAVTDHQPDHTDQDECRSPAH
ncbi:hypothetical protein D9M68_406590 [compost metagenome]